MAKEIAAQMGAWKKVEAKVESVDTGDILNPLRRVQQQYLDQAAKHEAAGKLERAAYYHEQAINVGRMLGDSLALELRRYHGTNFFNHFRRLPGTLVSALYLKKTLVGDEKPKGSTE
jgi:type VI protein secretion system component VasK